MVPRPFTTGVLPRLCILFAALIVAGCTARQYKHSADKAVYGILQDFDRKVFGRTNEAFGIETRYSQRDIKDITPAEIIGDRTKSNFMVINLDQALDMAVQNSREYQTQKEQLYLTALSLTGARYEFSPQFYADSTPQIAGVPEGTQIGTIRNRVGVSQLLKTGGSISVSLANDLVRYFTGKPDVVDRSSVLDTLSVELSQPLLRGFGANSPLVEQLTQAERNVIYGIRAYGFYQKQFAVDTVTSYFNLLTQKDIVRNNYRSFTNKLETTRYLEARSVDRERRSQVDDARNSELSAQRDYINSVASYLTLMDSFKLRLGIPISTKLYLDDADLNELLKAGLLPVEIDKNAAFAICLEQQPEVLTAIDKFEDSKRKVRIAADQLRAEVGLFGTAKLSDTSNDYLNFDPNQVRYTAGLTINLPIDRLRERNNYRATLISFESQIRSLGLTLDNYKDRIDRGLRTIEQARLNFLNGEESLKVATRRVENNSMLLEAGRATVRDLREAQDQLIAAENNLATLYTAYLSARLNLMLNIGVIDTSLARFWLADPLKDKLKPGQIRPPELRMPDDHVLPPETFLEPAA